MESKFTPEQQQYIADCKSNPKITEWLSQFRESDVDRFLADYYLQRGQWNQFGARYAADEQSRITSAMHEAEMVLYYIQQKKLFDLQCLWRAGQAEVPGVQFSGDFLLMELKIKNLDVISPVSAAEVELLKDFVTDYRWSRNLYVHFGWQNYDSMVREEADAEIGIPMFFKFACQRLKEPALWRVLPDKRGKLESAYRAAASKARRAAAEPMVKDMPIERDYKKPLFIYGEEEAEFAKRFDDHVTNECRTAYLNQSRIDEDQELRYALDVLHHAEEKITLEGGLYWLDAVKQAAFRYERSRVAKALDVVFENYLFRRQMGISLPDEPLEGASWLCGPPEYLAAEILNGREALGEPRDFNF